MCNKIKVFLASQSPRRRELLGQVFDYIRIVKTDPVEPAWEKKWELTDFMETCLQIKWECAQKSFISKNISRGSQLPQVLVVADTIVALGGKLLGKPRDKAEAEKMLLSLSGSTHTVLTGYRAGLWTSSSSKMILFSKMISSRVEFRKLSKTEITDYVRRGEPMDKAGAYGLQGEGFKFIEKINGSYLSVMGFPLYEFVRHLESKGIDVY